MNDIIIRVVEFIALFCIGFIFGVLFSRRYNVASPDQVNKIRQEVAKEYEKG